jgi:hypothetical protein
MMESHLFTASVMMEVKENGYLRCSCLMLSIKTYHTNFMSSLCPEGIRNFCELLVFHREKN